MNQLLAAKITRKRIDFAKITRLKINRNISWCFTLVYLL